MSRSHPESQATFFEHGAFSDPRARFWRHRPIPHVAEGYIQQHELEKGPFHRALIEAVNEVTNRALKRYGVRPFDIDPPRVRLLAEEGFRMVVGEKAAALSDAYYSHETDNFLMCIGKGEKEFELARSFLHEAFHGKCFNLVYENKQKDTVFRRFGITVPRSEKSLETAPHSIALIGIDEAITEGLVKRSAKALKEHRLLRPYLHFDPKGQAALKREVSRKTRIPYGEIFHVRDANQQPILFRYRSQRYALEAVLKAIRQDSRIFHDDTLHSTEEVFGLFARAQLKGPLLEVGRRMKRSFGENGLRTLGIMQRDANSAREVKRVMDKTRRQILEDRKARVQLAVEPNT